LENWVSTIGRKVWQFVRHSIQVAVNQNNRGRTPGLLPEQADSTPVLAYDQHHRRPVIILPTIPGRSDLNAPPMTAAVHRRMANFESDRRNYLLDRENCTADIIKLNAILLMPHVLLEIGCGNAEAALQIALKNPGIGVIATDLYDWSAPPSNGSGYGQIARVWRRRQLPAQLDTPANLVILKAETDLLFCLPVRAIDTILLINPEPRAGKTILDLLKGESIAVRMKHGPMQIVILPYSRELGLMACGGCGFEHDPDWSRGLGFMMGSGLGFQRGAPVQWGVDLSRISAYTGNSTQRDIYICGKPPF
jgi:hypothetical protein